MFKESVFNILCMAVSFYVGWILCDHLSKPEQKTVSTKPEPFVGKEYSVEYRSMEEGIYKRETTGKNEIFSMWFHLGGYHANAFRLDFQIQWIKTDPGDRVNLGPNPVFCTTQKVD